MRETAGSTRRYAPEGYRQFASNVKATKLELLEFRLKAAREGKSVAGYGTPGKERHADPLLRNQ